MKLYLLLFFMPLSCFAQFAFHLHGHTTDYFNGKMLYFTVYDNYSDHPFNFQDSVMVKNNEFLYSGIIHHASESAQISYVDEKNAKYSYEFVLDSGSHQMIIHPVPEDYIYFRNKVSILTFPGSLANESAHKLDSIRMYYMKTYGEYTDSLHQIRVLPLKAENQKVEAQRILINTYNSTYFSIVELYKLSHTRLALDSIQKSLLMLAKDLQSTSLYKELNGKVTDVIHATAASKVGQKAPVFTVKTDKGSDFNNQSLQGIPYVIVFSATWCIPCQEALPELQRLYEKYKSKGLQFVYFNLDDNVNKWKKHIARHHLNWINVSTISKFDRNNQIYKLYNLNGVPNYIVVNKNSIITFNSNQGDNDVALLKEYIEKLF